jgi:hypothetical protein
MINLESLKVVEKAYTKKSNTGQPREQHYELYFQRANRKSATKGVIVTETFILSNKTFEQLGLNQGNGIVALDGGSATLFGVVAEADAMFFKGKESKGVRQDKGQSFKSDVVAGFLVRDGILDGDAIGNTFLRLELVPDSVGFTHPSSGITFVGGLYQVLSDPTGEIRMGNAAISKEDTSGEVSEIEEEEL